MNLRRDLPSTRGDFSRLADRHAVTLAALGVVASLVRFHRAVSRG